MTDSGMVFIVDDEEPVRDSIGLLLRSVGIRSQGFPNARTFLDGCELGQRGCLIVDVRMPRMSGLELQQELNRRGWAIPLIFITGHGDVPMAVEAMRAGALDFLQKPFKDDELIRRVQKALDLDEKLHEDLRSVELIRNRYESLTPREREVAARLAAGTANKTVAIDLGLSERTVEVHRARVMQKLGIRGVAQLVQFLLKINQIVP